MNLDAAIAEIARTIQERDAWLDKHGARADYQWRVDALRLALETLQELRNER